VLCFIFLSLKKVPYNHILKIIKVFQDIIDTYIYIWYCILICSWNYVNEKHTNQNTYNKLGNIRWIDKKGKNLVKLTAGALLAVFGLTFFATIARPKSTNNMLKIHIALLILLLLKMI